MPDDQPVRIFVSYARDDRRWVDRNDSHHLIPHLISSLRKQNVEVWFDAALVASEVFKRTIEQEIRRADIAILLVSQSFLNSEFIEAVELPEITKRTEDPNFHVVPILIGYSDWQELEILAERQVLPGPPPTPLIDYTTDPAKWDKVRFEITSEIKTLVRRVREYKPILNYNTESEAKSPTPFSQAATEEFSLADTSLGNMPIDAKQPLTAQTEQPILRDAKASRVQKAGIKPEQDQNAALDDLPSHDISSEAPTHQHPVQPSAPIKVAVATAPVAKNATPHIEVIEPTVETSSTALTTALPASEPATDSTKINPIDGAEMIWIPPGPFLMGELAISGMPRRSVTLPGFWIYRNLVTVEQYKRYCNAKSIKMPYAPGFNREWKKLDHPIVSVSWDDAWDYCNWASVSLPTEAQWEKAARGTDGRIFPWGNEFEGEKVWGSDSDLNDAKGTSPVGIYGISPYGCSDMAGNVWQWCDDHYGNDFNKISPIRDPSRSKSGDLRPLRGGPWRNGDPASVRCTLSVSGSTNFGLSYSGFRCVLNSEKNGGPVTG